MELIHCVFFIFIFSLKKRMEFAALRMEEDSQENFVISPATSTANKEHQSGFLNVWFFLE